MHSLSHLNLYTKTNSGPDKIIVQPQTAKRECGLVADNLVKLGQVAGVRSWWLGGIGGGMGLPPLLSLSPPSLLQSSVLHGWQ